MIIDPVCSYSIIIGTHNDGGMVEKKKMVVVVKEAGTREMWGLLFLMIRYDTSEISLFLPFWEMMKLGEVGMALSSFHSSSFL